MLKQRLITALVLLAVLIAALLAPRPEFFGALTLVFVAIGGWEWSRLNGMAGTYAYVLGVLVAVICMLMGYFGVVSQLPAALWLIAASLWLVGAPVILKGGGQLWLSIPQAVRWGLGVFVLCLAWAALWSAKLMGNNFLLSVLFLVWIADSGAYFGGKALGRRKLAPSISPGKSWEGAVCGLMAVFVLAYVWIVLDRSFSFSSQSIFTIILYKWSWLGLLILTVLMTVMSVVGDLFESLMKRSVGIKDSSQILPGHGGVLDRTDALLPVLPIAIALTALVGIC